MEASADAYKNEPVKYPALHITNLKDEGASVADSYRNQVINRVNGSCLRLAVFDGEYRGRAGVATPAMGECDHPGHDDPPHAGDRADREPMFRRTGCGDSLCRSGGITSGCTGRGATDARSTSSGCAPRR